LKNGWQKVRLGELAELKGRIGWRGLTAKEYTKAGPFFLSVHSLNYGDYVDWREAFHISQHRYDESPEIMLQRDDVLICKDGAGIGKVGIVGRLPGPTTINSSLLLIRNGKRILPKFLYFCLTSPYFQEIVQSRLNGATTPHLYQRDITEFPVVLPPLPEQQRIIALLEEAFDGLATANAIAQKNLRNTCALFDSHLRSVFDRNGGWVARRLGDLAEIQSGGTPLVSKREYWCGSIPWYSSGELNTTFTADPVRHITSAGLSNSNAKLFPKGSLLIGMYDTAALKMSILDREGAFNQAIAGIRPNEKIDLEFVLHAINARKPELLLERRGVRQKNLSLGKIKDVMIPVPIPAEQRAVASRLRTLMVETHRLEQLYGRKVKALGALKKALLHQAFSGML
jgi:type I restriction enzyme S subunit